MDVEKKNSFKKKRSLFRNKTQEPKELLSVVPELLKKMQSGDAPTDDLADSAKKRKSEALSFGRSQGLSNSPGKESDCNTISA